jgi:hypothetical protein
MKKDRNMKKIILILVLILVFIFIFGTVIFCKVTDLSLTDVWITISKHNVINEQVTGDKGMFYLGMPVNKVKTKINELKIKKFVNTDYIWTPYMSFYFDNHNILERINVTRIIPTKLGLRVGDPESEIEKLYGKDYKSSTSEVCIYSKKHKSFSTAATKVYTYRMGDHYLNVVSDTDSKTIFTWVIYKE